MCRKRLTGYFEIISFPFFNDLQLTIGSLGFMCNIPQKLFLEKKYPQTLELHIIEGEADYTPEKHHICH